MGKALIVVDIQNDFCSGGPLAVPDGEFVVPLVNDLMRSGGYDTIVLTQDWHPVSHMSFASNHERAEPFGTVTLSYGDQTLWPTHCLAGSRGAQFHNALDTVLAHAVIRKGMNPLVDSYSGFRENDRLTPTGLQGYLTAKAVTDVDVCGLALDYCVKYTAIDACLLGFKTRIILDACRSLDAGVRPEEWEEEHEGLSVIARP